MPNLGEVLDQLRREGGGPSEGPARDHGEQHGRCDADVGPLLVVVLYEGRGIDGRRGMVALGQGGRELK